MHGLRDSDLVWIHGLLKKYPSVEAAYIFGSRARGTHRSGSDVDIALVGSSITPAETRQIKLLLEEESPMPFFFDVVHIERLTDVAFQEKIKAECIQIYLREQKIVHPIPGSL